jgi:DNA-binding CsgD family transcriptional regulator
MRFFNTFCLLIVVCGLHARTPTSDSLKLEIERARASNNRYAEAQNLSHLARHLAETGWAREAVDHATAAINIFESLGKTSEAYHAYVPLLAIHQQLHNPQKIIEYAQPALAYAKDQRDTALWTQMLTGMGIGYDELNEYDKSIACYLTCIQLDEAAGRLDPVNYCNASSTYTYMNNFDNGIKYAKKAIEIGTNQQDTAAMCLGWLNLSYVLALSGRSAESDAAADQSDVFAKVLGYDQMERDLAQIRSINAANRKDYQAAYQYFQQYYTLDSAMSSVGRNAEFAELEAIYQYQKKTAENARLDAQIKQQWWLIGGSLVVAMLLAFAFWQQYRRRMVQSRLLAAEQQLTEAERRRSEEEKAYLRQSLTEQARLLIEKSNAIDALRQELTDTIQGGTSLDYAQELTNLCQNAILTDADWRNFSQKFERVYPGFFEQFDAMTEDASEADRRLAAFQKMGLSTAEIAAMLGISVDSVYKSRYRFKKKMGDVDVMQLIRAM